MTELTRVCVTSTAENALKKLQRAQIPVYDCKKQGAYFIFCVKDKQVEKVFAIFAKPCYNITVRQLSLKKRLFSTLVIRLGLIVGALIFVVAAAVSDFFILKIEVSGSGGYLKSAVREIIEDEGGYEGRPFASLNCPVATGKILALPQVVFCNIQKRGSVLIVDVEVDNTQNNGVIRQPLVADEAGRVTNIVAICGTPARSVGDSVNKGDVLIFPYALAGEETYDCIAVGYAELECVRTAEYLAPDDSEQSRSEAYASVISERDVVLSRSHKTYPAQGGVRFVIEVKYLHKVSINLT